MTEPNARNVSNTVAKATTELAAIEESGKVAGKTNFMELAELIGLDGSKLQAIAGGWLPAQKDLSAWRELRCFTTTDSYSCFDHAGSATIGATSYAGRESIALKETHRRSFRRSGRRTEDRVQIRCA